MNRRAVLAGLLAPTLAASLWLALQTPAEDDTVVAAAPRPGPSGAAPAGGTAGTALTAANAATAASAPGGAPSPRAPWPEPGAAALAAWAGAAPPAPAAPAGARQKPEPARPPAFPYQWIGNLDDGSGPQALLSGAQRSFGVRVGELIDGQWRVEQLAGRGLQLSWVATGERVDIAAR